MNSFKLTAVLILLASLIQSCGKDNQTSTLVPTPTPVIDNQNISTSNILSPFDPSFEDAESTTNNRRLPTLNGRFFRVKNKRRNVSRRTINAQIVNGISFSGNKALQLFDADSQILVFPLDTNREGRPLNLIPGARYRVSAKVKIGNSQRRAPFQAKFSLKLYSDEERLGKESETKKYFQENGNWITLSQEFETPSLVQKGQFELELLDVSDAIIDDLALVRIR